MSAPPPRQSSEKRLAPHWRLFEEQERFFELVKLNALAPDSLNGFTAALLRAGVGAYVREALDRRRAAIVSGLVDQWADSFG